MISGFQPVLTAAAGLFFVLAVIFSALTVPIIHNHLQKGVPCMLYAIVVASGLLAVLLALAWAKEVRLSKALQRLLAKLFHSWRTTTHETSSPDHAADNPVDDPDSADRGRL